MFCFNVSKPAHVVSLPQILILMSWCTWKREINMTDDPQIDPICTICQISESLLTLLNVLAMSRRGKQACFDVFRP